MFTVDDEHIIYAREHSRRRHIWIMNADGSQQTQRTTGDVLDDPLSLSKDGRYLVFNRGELSFGAGKQAHAYLMRIDKHDSSLISVGDIAVFSPDSKFVVFLASEKLWRLELTGTETPPRQLVGSGVPLDISQDGKWILTNRLRSNTDTSVEYELRAVNIDNGADVFLGNGNSAIFLERTGEKILFYRRRVPFVTSIRGGPATRIGADSTYKTFPRRVLKGRAAIAASFPQLSSPAFDIILIDSENLRIDKIAAIDCTDVSFHIPQSVVQEK
jgi:hypothetical protein